MTVVKAMQLSIMGPGLALRGPEGSMTRAVLVMRSEYKSIHGRFYFGLICIHISAALFLWISLSNDVVAPINTVLVCVALVWLYLDFNSLEKRLRLPGRSITYDASKYYLSRETDGQELNAHAAVDEARRAAATSSRSTQCANLPRRRMSNFSSSKMVRARKINATAKPKKPSDIQNHDHTLPNEAQAIPPNHGSGPFLAGTNSQSPSDESRLSVFFLVVQGNRTPMEERQATNFTIAMPIESTLGDARDMAAAELRWAWTTVALYIEVEPNRRAEQVGLTVETLATPLHVLCNKMRCSGTAEDPLYLWIMKKEP